jgi:hypothetical protein
MALPFPFAPDWTQPIVERLSWLTAIQTSRSGAEQRQALRLTPRRAFDIPVQLVGQERSYFDVLLGQNGGGIWNVPIPHEEISVGVVSAEQTVFYINPSFREIGIGYKLLLRGSCFQAEVVEVTAIGSDTIMTTPVVLSYDAATLTPTFEGVISDRVQTSRLTARIYTATVRFTTLEPTVWRPPMFGPAPLVFPGVPPSLVINGKSFPVLTQPPNAVNSLDYDYERMWSVVDNDTSIPVYTDKSARQFTSQKYEFFLVGKEERYGFRDLLYALRGKQTPLWVPTFNDDFAVGYGYPNPMGLPHTVIPGRDYFVIFYRDGTPLTAYPAPAYDGQPPEIFSAGNVARISFVTLKRLDVDDIEIQHYGTLESVATVSVVFRDAPDLRALSYFITQPFRDPVYHTASGDVPPTNDVGADSPTMAGLIAPQTITAD